MKGMPECMPLLTLPAGPAVPDYVGGSALLIMPIGRPANRFRTPEIFTTIYNGRTTERLRQ